MLKAVPKYLSFAMICRFTWALPQKKRLNARFARRGTRHESLLAQKSGSGGALWAGDCDWWLIRDSAEIKDKCHREYCGAFFFS